MTLKVAFTILVFIIKFAHLLSKISPEQPQWDESIEQKRAIKQKHNQYYQHDKYGKPWY